MATFKFSINMVCSLLTDDGWLYAEGKDENDAIQNWHAKWYSDYSDGVYDQHVRGEGKETEYFLIAYNETGERLISRICANPLRRRGGVKLIRQYETRQELAVRLGLPPDALDQPWEDDEQTYF